MSDEARRAVVDCVTRLSKLINMLMFDEACQKLSELLSAPDGIEVKLQMSNFLIDCITTEMNKTEE